MTQETNNSDNKETITTNKYIKDFTPKAKKEILEFFREHLKTSHLEALENNPQGYINEVLDKVTPCYGDYSDDTPIYYLSQFDSKDGNPADLDFRRDDFIYADE